MLQRQGVGYLDETVASVVSASADRFLATVLQQSIACRDQRLKGAAMTREAAKQRKRHMEDYEADNDDRKRRKDSIIKAREDIAKITIEAAEAIKRGGNTSTVKATASSATDKKGSKKKKGSRKVVPASVPSGPREVDPAMEALAREESEEEYDSIDEEEEYYQDNVVDVTRERISLKETGGNEDEEDDEDEEEDDDEDDDTLLLRDIVRPLEAWNFHLNGKEAIETDEDYDGFVENNEDIQNGESSKTNIAGVSTAQKEQIAEEKGRIDNDNMLGALMNGIEESKQQSSNEKKQGDAPANGSKNGAAKKTSASVSSSTNNPPSTSWHT